MPTTNPVLALLVADLHWSHKPPLVRAGESDWYAAMDRPLAELRNLQQQYGCPVLVAGDLFDDGWCPHRCPPQLVNFALRSLPERCWAVPGQHDLPHHRLEDVTHSAFFTLVEAGRINYLHAATPMELSVVGGRVLRLHGFPWGVIPHPLENRCALCVEVAVVHDYAWTKKTGYVGADGGKRVSSWQGKLTGYDLAVFGDNHVPFQWRNLYNCGAFTRRRADEKDHKPSVGLLHPDLTITRHYLDCSQDAFDDSHLEAVRGPSSVDPSELIAELRDLGGKCLDFTEALERLRATRRLDDGVWQIILEALGGVS